MLKLTSRKFLFAVLLVVLSFVLTMVGKLGINEWLAFVGTVGGAYVLVNQAESMSKK